MVLLRPAAAAVLVLRLCSHNTEASVDADNCTQGGKVYRQQSRLKYNSNTIAGPMTFQRAATNRTRRAARAARWSASLRARRLGMRRRHLKALALTTFRERGGRLIVRGGDKKGVNVRCGAAENGGDTTLFCDDRQQGSSFSFWRGQRRRRRPTERRDERREGEEKGTWGNRGAGRHHI